MSAYPWLSVKWSKFRKFRTKSQLENGKQILFFVCAFCCSTLIPFWNDDILHTSMKCEKKQVIEGFTKLFNHASSLSWTCECQFAKWSSNVSGVCPYLRNWNNHRKRDEQSEGYNFWDSFTIRQTVINWSLFFLFFIFLLVCLLIIVSLFIFLDICFFSHFLQKKVCEINTCQGRKSCRPRVVTFLVSQLSLDEVNRF